MHEILASVGLQAKDWYDLRVAVAMRPLDEVLSCWTEHLIKFAALPVGLNMCQLQAWCGSLMGGYGALYAVNGM